METLPSDAISVLNQFYYSPSDTGIYHYAGEEYPAVRIASYADLLIFQQQIEEGTDNKINELIAQVDAIIAGVEIEINNLSNQIDGLSDQISGLANGFVGGITLSSPAPTKFGIYYPTQEGTYMLYGGLSYAQSEGAVAFLYNQDGTFSKQVTQVNLSSVLAIVSTLQTQVTDINSLIFETEGDGKHRFLDDNGNVGGIIHEDGEFQVSKLTGQILAVGNVDNFYTPDYNYVLIDDNNNIGLKIDLGSDVLQGKFSTPTVVSTYTPTYGQLADNEGQHTEGQSNSDGTDGLPTITNAPIYSNKMLKGGMRFWDAPGNTTDISALVPAIEQASTNDNQLGETCMSGAMNMYIQRLTIDTGIVHNAPNYKYALIGATPGLGGMSIQQLSKGTQLYQRNLDAIEAELDLCIAAGETYVFRCMYWVHGDNNAQSDKIIYKDLLKKLRLDYQTDIKALIKSKIGVDNPDIPMIMYQFCHYNFYNGFPNVTLAQLELAQSEPGFFLALPSFALPYSGDRRHLTALGHLTNGVNLGYIAYRHLIEKENPRPFVAQSYKIFGKIVEIKYNPKGTGLVIDNTTVTPTANNGFLIINGGAGAITITSVAIVRPDTLKIIFSRNIASGDKLTYAMNGIKNSTLIADQAKGNIRDNQGDTIVYTQGIYSIPVHNWMHSHELTF